MADTDVRLPEQAVASQPDPPRSDLNWATISGIVALITVGILILQQISAGVAHVARIDYTVSSHDTRLDRLENRAERTDNRVAHVEIGIAAIRGRLGIPEFQSPHGDQN